MIPTAWRKGWSAVATVALCATACRDVPAVQTATATRRSLRVPILADGAIEPPPGREVRAPEAGVIGAIYVREGQRVAQATAEGELAARGHAVADETLRIAEEVAREGRGEANDVPLAQIALADSDDDAANARARLAAARARLLILRGQLPGQ